MRSLLVLIPGFVATAALVLPVIAPQTSEDSTKPITGFGRLTVVAQHRTEHTYREIPSAERIEADHRFLTEKPHIAGSPRDRELAEWIRDRWRAFGIDTVEIVEHEVLLPYPERVSVEMTAPHPWRASMTEDPIEGDTDPSEGVGLPYHAYSASGDIAAPVVYAGSGNPSDYQWLASQGIDIKGKIALVRYSVPYSYRGFKALTAERLGAAGILIYSDPADDGFAKGKTYPDGPWGPESHIQRGGIVYDFMVPGDPLTPGWASVPGARRISSQEATSLPRIMSAPLSSKDARVILESLEGPAAPSAWQGALPLTYHTGPGPATIRVQLQMDDKVRRIWTVVGTLRGAAIPDEWVVLGNHRDAWVYGGVDPSSGSASLMEVARGLGTLARRGLRPKRSIVLASWDAEEFTLTSSTEWGEQFEKLLSDRVVAYLNVDSSASGPNFSAAAVPTLNRVVTEVAEAVTDPGARVSVLVASRDRRSRERGTLPTGGGDEIVNNRLGSGSDYTVFLNFLGIPIVDMTFDGPYGVYHSMYDNHQWVSRIGDPGFRYHTAMSRLWGIMALRLANADLLPYDHDAYASRIAEFVDELDARWPMSSEAFGEVRQALERLREGARALEREGIDALAANDSSRLARLNRVLLAAERGWLDPEGIPGRPWYRHLIYAPKYTYAPEVLPGVAEAIEAADGARVDGQLKKLASAIDRVTTQLGRFSMNR